MCVAVCGEEVLRVLVSQDFVDGGRPVRQGHVDWSHQVHVDPHETLECDTRTVIIKLEWKTSNHKVIR